MSTTTPTDTVNALVTALFRGFDVDAAAPYLAPDYIQHNPAIPDRAEGLLSLLPAAEESGLTVETHRVIAEGELVVLHNTFRNAHLFGAETLVSFDVFRVRDGKAVEHWDNLQAPPATTASGRSMTDGPTTPTDLDRTAENKALVAGFIDEVFIGGRLEVAADYITAEPGAYHQHNPLVPDGLDAVGAAFAALAEAGQGFTFHTRHQTVAQGDLVFTMTEGHMGEVPTAFFDLWRVADGKIVEHWDVIESIPADMVHGNGKF
ncbi:MAG: nuclear transport factor 2 family protein [Actinomycetota bacterium]